jgi:hypothetical protein
LEEAGGKIDAEEEVVFGGDEFVGVVEAEFEDGALGDGDVLGEGLGGGGGYFGGSGPVTVIEVAGGGGLDADGVWSGGEVGEGVIAVGAGEGAVGAVVGGRLGGGDDVDAGGGFPCVVVYDALDLGGLGECGVSQQ